MPLLLRKTRQPADRAPEASETPAHSQYTSQAFNLWDEESSPGGKRHVLELASARPENLVFFGAEPCRLQVIGLDRVLPLDVAPDDEEEDTRQREVDALRAHLPPLPERFQHGALVWDLPNFLTPAQLVELGQWLAGALKLDAAVHVVIYTGLTMPARPCRFHVAERDQLVRGEPGSGSVECPRLSQRELKRCWPDFEVLRSFLLRNESQEFVFRRL